MQVAAERQRPASDFFKSLLKYYGIEYLNLNPNGIFHVSVFVEDHVWFEDRWMVASLCDE
jgi:hypothetical protein